MACLVTFLFLLCFCVCSDELFSSSYIFSLLASQQMECMKSRTAKRRGHEEEEKAEHFFSTDVGQIRQTVRTLCAEGKTKKSRTQEEEKKNSAWWWWWWWWWWGGGGGERRRRFWIDHLNHLNHLSETMNEERRWDASRFLITNWSACVQVDSGDFPGAEGEERCCVRILDAVFAGFVTADAEPGACGSEDEDNDVSKMEGSNVSLSLSCLLQSKHSRSESGNSSMNCTVNLPHFGLSEAAIFVKDGCQRPALQLTITAHKRTCSEEEEQRKTEKDNKDKWSERQNSPVLCFPALQWIKMGWLRSSSSTWMAWRMTSSDISTKGSLLPGWKIAKGRKQIGGGWTQKKSTDHSELKQLGVNWMQKV